MAERVDRPNILLIMTDQQRWDTLGAAGNPTIQTPNLDRLAREGTLFSEAFSPSPVCAPARAALISGYSPSRLHFTSNSGYLTDQEDTLPTLLNQAGYHTQALGKMHFPQADGGHDRPWAATCGFQDLLLSEETRWVRQARSLAEVAFDDYDRFLLEHGLWGWGTPPEIGYNEIKPILSALPEEYGVTSWLGDRAVEYLAGPHDRPFFAFVSFVKPHAPYDPPAEWAGMYDPYSVPPPMRTPAERFRPNPQYEQERQRREWDLYSEYAELTSRAYYYANISLIDKQVGRILDALESAGLREKTFIVFTSDHGDLLGDHWLWFKNHAFDSCARVPLIVAGPGVPGGVRVDGPVVNLLDLFATILARARVSVPANRPSRDLLAYLPGEGAAHSEFVVMEVNDVGRRCRALRSRDLLYVHWEDGGFEELYDLRQDPFQLHDLGSLPATLRRRQEYRTALIDWLKEWGDPAWELDTHGDLHEHEFRGLPQIRWLPRPHGRTPFESRVPPRLWPKPDDWWLWWWRAVDGDASRLLDLAWAGTAEHQLGQQALRATPQARLGGRGIPGAERTEKG
jgi:arylsulfatase A-like enzyme